jgi:hypothetical protein
MVMLMVMVMVTGCPLEHDVSAKKNELRNSLWITVFDSAGLQACEKWQ